MRGPVDTHFPSIHWTLIERLKSSANREVDQALEDIFGQYHHPLYCYIRRRGLEHHDAQDALHDFFLKLLRTNALAAADERKGSLAGLLAVSLQRYLINWRQGRKVQNREASLDEMGAFAESEACYLKERFRENETPEHLLDRKWAQEFLLRVLQRLGTDYAASGKTALFIAFKPALQNGGSLRGEDAAALGEELNMTEGALRTAFSRLLRDYRKVLENEVRLTVETQDEVKDEIARLRELFVGR